MSPRPPVILAFLVLLSIACGPGPASPPPPDVPADTVEDAAADTPPPPEDTAPDSPPPVICEPGSRRCTDAGVEACEADGTAWVLELACDPAELCLEDPFRCCLPDCVGKTCGPDGCGGDCGGCPRGLSCGAGGKCEETCEPDCSGRVCGSDGCGGGCGTCAPGEECLEGACAVPCAPSCADATCGPDGCGGVCGPPCGEGMACGEVLFGRHCTKPCLDLADCPPELFCLGGWCNPPECLVDGDCPAGEACDPFLRCAASMSCSGTDPCFPIEDPVTGGELPMTCDPDTSRCVPTGEPVCDAGQCWPQAGACAWTAPGPGFCDDGEPCTDDSCDPVEGCLHASSATLPCLEEAWSCPALHALADGAIADLAGELAAMSCEVHGDCHLCLYLEGVAGGCPSYLWAAAAADVSLLLGVDQALAAKGCDADAACGPPPEPLPPPCCVGGACVFGSSCAAWVDSCLSVAACGSPDSDGDGLGDGCDPDDDGDGETDAGDCAPLDPLAFPGAEERCNFQDDDCDGATDEGLPEVGTPCVSEDPAACDPAGWWICDALTGAAVCLPQAWPGAQELCDGKDNDCDGTVDEPGSPGCVACWADEDGDGFGAGLPPCVCTGTPEICAAQAPGDCDDEDPDAHPGLPELCNGVDDDCDGQTDEGC
ncbi:MAG: putative metal-binding motif-containing protein [Deltaproteobacteria bacterium]|nr:putative metal-binding motif-containing protein [Deltaproteobacteria bacterium]